MVREGATIPSTVNEFNWFLEHHCHRDEGCEAAKVALETIGLAGAKCLGCPFPTCIDKEDNYRRQKWITALAFGFQAGVIFSAQK